MRGVFVIGSRIGARVLLVAILVVGIGLGVAAQYWSMTPSILGHFHWELPRPRQFSGVIGAEFGVQLQAAHAFVSSHFHWEVAPPVVAALADTFVH
jgi:hypothetical protein